MSDVNIAVIGASVRADRIGPRIVEWVSTRLATRDGLAVEVLDPVSAGLPDERALRPGGGTGSGIAATLAEADGYVFVTPEYNHSYPAPVKRLIDAHYHEWMFKPATVVSYGAQGGLLAVEHLRGVLAELHVVVTRRVVGLRAPWEHLAPATSTGAGGFRAEPGVDRALDGAVAELLWWAETLRTARRDRPFVA